MPPLHPLEIEEVAERCISHLSPSPRDLKACALVSGRWIHAAQSQLFRAPRITSHSNTVAQNSAAWASFEDTLGQSPHLIRHIRDLNIHLNAEDIETLSAICRFPFTNLASFHIYQIGTFSATHATALRRLVGLPSLHRVGINCSFADGAAFLEIWDDCPPRLEHLELCCRQRWPPVLSPDPRSIPHRRSLIAVESLRMFSPETYRLACRQDIFDLSRLRILRIGHQAHIPWCEFAPRILHIEVLDLVVEARLSAPDHAMNLDLSAFPNLSSLRLEVPHCIPPVALKSLQLLSSLGSSSALRRISICCASFEEDGLCEWLDRTVASLPLEHLPMLELETRPAYFQRLVCRFPRLESRSLLVRSARSSN
ncbi:hypothetical protein C8R46DRAFT_1263057 [Mycena filopes]|nr:hypothetical protein C8R46DRAFT_1263057 [Mycena filopes]